MEIECHPFSRLIIVGPPLIMQSLPSTFHFPPSRRLEHSAKPRGIALRRCNQNVWDKAAIPWAARWVGEIPGEPWVVPSSVLCFKDYKFVWIARLWMASEPSGYLVLLPLYPQLFSYVRLTVTMSDFLLRFHYYIIMCLTLTLNRTHSK